MVLLAAIVWPSHAAGAGARLLGAFFPLVAASFFGVIALTLIGLT